MSAKVDAFEGTSRRHTAEPRWPTARPALDGSGRRHVIVAGADASARAAAAAWLDEAELAGAGAVLVDAGDAASLRAALETATATTRLLAAGSESDLAAATAGAELAGMTPKEVRAVLTDAAGTRPVQCVHCRAITHAEACVEETCECVGCGVELLVFAHYSRRIGAYLGFQVDAEELP